eukprot:3922020-Pyramimonas_sp.AAC.1
MSFTQSIYGLKARGIESSAAPRPTAAMCRMEEGLQTQVDRGPRPGRERTGHYRPLPPRVVHQPYTITWALLIVNDGCITTRLV